MGLAQCFLHCCVMSWIPSSLFSSSPAQLQISSALVPVSVLPHRKHGSQPQQVSGTPAMPASGSSLHHCAFPEDGGGQGAGGTWAQQGMPPGMGLLQHPIMLNLPGTCTGETAEMFLHRQGKLLLHGEQLGQKGGNVAGMKSTYLRDNLKALLI